jgi:hypothetical protein
MVASLTERIVAKGPARFVRVGDRGALVGRIVLILETHGRVRRGSGGNLRQPVEIVKAPGRRQPRRAALLERGAFHQRRIGQIAVGYRARPIRDGGKPRRVVIWFVNDLRCDRVIGWAVIRVKSCCAFA